MSSSMDKTIVIWSFDKETGVWMDDVSIIDANFDSSVKTDISFKTSVATNI